MDDGSETAIFPSGLQGPHFQVRASSLILVAGLVCLVAIALIAYRYASPTGSKVPNPDPNLSSVPSVSYWEMDQDQQDLLIRQRLDHVFALVGDDPVALTDEETDAIRTEINRYVERRDSLSQEQFREGLRTIYGRASQYAGLIKRTFERRKVPGILGIYQAMIESEYRDCPSHPHERGPVGLFQFSRKVAERYNLKASEYCNVEKQADAAARHMSDLLSDFGSEKGSWTLALLSFNDGTDTVRDYLRATRARGVTERTYWAIRRDRNNFNPPLRDDSLAYVVRFIAVAVIGETPEAFGLPMSPLSEH